MVLSTRFERVRTGIFDGPQIRTLRKDLTIVLHLTVVESAAWCSYISVVKEFVGKTKVDCYQDVVKQMPKNVQAFVVRMSRKIYHLLSHLSRFPENLAEKSEEQG